jgi:hypothetical protein
MCVYVCGIGCDLWCRQLEADGQLAITKTVSVLDGVTSPSGKWGTSLGNVAVLEAKYGFPPFGGFCRYCHSVCCST